MRNGPARTPVALAGAVVSGVVVGVVTQILQGSLGGGSLVLANSAAVWALVAFALGWVMPSSKVAAIGGAICLAVASISYYVAVDVLEKISSTPRSAVVWSIAGIVAGLAFGFAGYAARHNQLQRRSAWALVAGVLIGEGIHLTWYVGNDNLRPAGIAEIAVAAIGALAILRGARSVSLVAAIMTGAALATLLATALINSVFAAL